MTSREACEKLGLDIGPLRKIYSLDGSKALRVLKLAAKKAFRPLALENHPDRYPDDKEKEETFKAISSARDALDKLDEDGLYLLLEGESRWEFQDLRPKADDMKARGESTFVYVSSVFWMPVVRW